MNVIAIERMENFAKEVLKLMPEMQDQFFNELESSGILSAEEVKGVKKYVALYHMFTDQRHYNAIKNCAYEMYMSEITR